MTADQGCPDARALLEWLLRRRINHSEIAEALAIPESTYSRRRKRPRGWCPTYEDLNLIGHHFGVSPRVLQIKFGHRGSDEVAILNDDELRQHHDLENYEAGSMRART